MDEEPQLRTRDWLPRTAALLTGTLALVVGLLTATLVRGRRAVTRPARRVDARPAT